MEQKQKKLTNIQLRTLISQVFNSDSGIVVLKVIKELSGYDKTNIVKTTDGELSTNAMLYNEGRRSVYLELRNLITPEVLSKTEIDMK